MTVTRGTPDALFDISRLVYRLGGGRLPTGVDRVCMAYLQRWQGRARAIIMYGPWRRMAGQSTSDALFELLLQPPEKGLQQRIYQEIARACIPPWPVQHAAQGWSFYLGHWGLEKPGFAQWVRSTGQRPVYFVHDLIPLTHPEYCRPGEAMVHARRMRVALQTGAALLVNSVHTLDQLGAWAHAHQLPMPPATVAPLAPAPLSLASGAGSAAATGPDPSLRPVDAPYFVVLGTIEPRKNHLLLLEVWRELVAQHGAKAPHLVVIGQRGWECENVVDMLERCTALRSHVHEISQCSDTQLARYLAHAQALLFPTFTEGYGMPLVEALLMGTPVIASDLAVFKEFAADVPEWLRPIDGAGWMQAVLDYADSAHPRRTAQVERLRHWRAPSWSDHFDAVDALLERLQ